MWDLAFAVWVFPPGWNGVFHFWRFSGESLGRLLQPVGSPLSFFRPFSVPPVVTAFTLRKALRLRNVPFFLFFFFFFFFPLCSPGLGLRGLAFAVLACFPPGWNGGSHSWRFSGESLGHLIRPVGSPRFQSLGCRATWSPWLLLLSSYCLRHVQVACSYRCRSCSSHPSPALFSSKTSASWVLTVSSAPDSERAINFWVVIPARYPSSASSPSNLVASWSGGSGACLPFFLFPLES